MTAPDQLILTAYVAACANALGAYLAWRARDRWWSLVMACTVIFVLAVPAVLL